MKECIAANIRIKTIYLVLKNKIKIIYITIVKFYEKSVDIIVKI